MKKLIILTICLLGIVLLGMIVLNREPQTSEVPDALVLSKNYIEVPFEPVFIKSEVLGTKTEKMAENSNLSDKRAFQELIEQYDWNTDEAYRIMMCESSERADAHNFNHSTRDNSHGLFQINTYGSLANERPSREWLIVPEQNVSYAYELWSETRSFGKHWVVCSRKEGIR